MNDGEHYTVLERNESGVAEIVKYAYKNQEKVGVIASEADMMPEKVNNPIQISTYFFNADETKLLIATSVAPIYRRSFKAQYYVYDIASKEMEDLSNRGPQMLAEFSPDGKKVAFVRENNIYVKDLESGKETTITTDGEKNSIINGTTDWVYEEEFAITKGFYWSPESNYIAYMKFREENVKEFQMSYYGPLYPYVYKFKYPKAGEENSKVEVHVYDLPNANDVNLGVSKDQDVYIPRIKWTSNNNEVLVQRMNRHQSKLEYLLYTINKVEGTDQSTASYRLVYEENADTYIEIDDNLIFTQDGKSFIRTSEIDGYNHIYKIGFDGKKVQITRGQWDVVEFKGLDQENGLIYYTSAEEGAMYKALYVTDMTGKKKKKLSSRVGDNDANFSTGMKYYINYYSNANQPHYITLHNAKGKELMVLEDNEELIKTLGEYNLPKKEFISVEGADGQLNGWIMKPNDFDENKQYPVYLAIYGGPGHNTVVDAYGSQNFLWHAYLVQQGYIVVSVDPRGTMYRGAAFKKSTYMQLGKLETEDMIAAAKWLQNKSWVDGERIGVQGWSYGGYMASLCMTKGADVFKMGIAVAPVTNWRFYDSIYTERFMRTPQENPDGYDDNSPINHVEKLKGPYLLVHGTADDNVHHQNTMEMIDALVKANKQFDLFLYPNKNHGIYGGNTRLHLYTKVTKFVNANL